MQANFINRDRTTLMISGGFIAVFALMLLVAYLSVSTMNGVNRSMADLIHNTDQKTSLAYQMRDVIRLRSAEVRAIAQTNNPEDREKIFDKLIQSTRTYNQANAKLKELAANQRESEVLTKMAEATARSNEAYDQAAGAIYAMENNPDALKSSLGNVQLRELVLLNQLNGLVQLEKELSAEALANNQSRYKKTLSWLIATVIATFLVSLLISGAVTNRVTAANKRIKHLAAHDDLTGLHNRRSFEAALKNTMAAAKRSNTAQGLMYLDFDRFKIVNDSCGHHAGDQLLTELSSMLQEQLNDADIFARVGGDEFAIITRGRDVKSIMELAENLRQKVQDYTFEYQSQPFAVSLSIGVIPITGKEESIETLLQDVDSACYVAKQMGRNRVHLAHNDDVEVVKYRNDIAGIQNIRNALDNDHLTLYYQPVHRITETGTEMAHCEILLRIINEHGETLSPADFIPIAEKYNLMAEIDRWVISNVMAWVAKHQNDYQIPRFLINLSGLSFIDEDFLGFVINELDHHGVDPANIAFEITETAAMDNIKQANAFIDELRKIGCHFALDDFGTGFSTFEYLKNLTIDYLKIDGSLVKNIATDRVDREMVRAINEIGHTVGAKTIAEFVEDLTIVDILREIGVEYAQGYGIQRPGALDELIPQLLSSTGNIEQWREAS